MVMSKASMLGWFVLAGAFALMIATKALGVDGNAQTAINALFAFAFAMIGLRGVSDLYVKPPEAK